MIRVDVDDKEIKVDFEDATLSDGQKIQKILEENVESKKKIVRLKKELKDSMSILSAIFPNKKIHSAVEIIMLILSAIGLINLLYYLFHYIYIEML